MTRLTLSPETSGNCNRDNKYQSKNQSSYVSSSYASSSAAAAASHAQSSRNPSHGTTFRRFPLALLAFLGLTVLGIISTLTIDEALLDIRKQRQQQDPQVKLQASSSLAEDAAADAAAFVAALLDSTLLANDSNSVPHELPDKTDAEVNNQHKDDKKSTDSFVPSITSNTTDHENNMKNKTSITEDQTMHEKHDNKKNIAVNSSHQEQMALVSQQPTLVVAVADTAASAHELPKSALHTNDTNSLRRELPGTSTKEKSNNQSDDKKSLFLPSNRSGSKEDINKNKNNTEDQRKNHDDKKSIASKSDFDSAYEEQLALVTQFDPTQRTLAFGPFRFYSGFINELMAFIAFIMYAYDNNFTQVLLPSLRWKDLFGTNQMLVHEFLFDVVHWNQDNATTPTTKMTNSISAPGNTTNQTENPTHTPASLHLQQRSPLPRLVAYHPSMTDLIQQHDNRLIWRGDPMNATMPFFCPVKQVQFFIRYRRHRKLNKGKNRHVSDLAILQGAFRPHPRLQQLVDQAKESMVPAAQATTFRRSAVDDTKEEAIAAAGSGAFDGGGYLCLHARIEPDMQKHPVCRDQKVTSLRHILDSIYAQYPDSPPPNVNRALIVLYRKLLEDENHEQNTLAKENLDLLNQLRREGMWNGTIPVYEAGSHFLPPDSVYAQKAPSIAGSILNYHLALDAQIFIGSPVSSFAMQVMATRYYRHDLGHQSTTTTTSSSQSILNYMYLPKGLELLPTHVEPPPFVC